MKENNNEPVNIQNSHQDVILLTCERHTLSLHRLLRFSDNPKLFVHNLPRCFSVYYFSDKCAETSD